MKQKRGSKTILSCNCPEKKTYQHFLQELSEVELAFLSSRETSG